MSKSAGLHPLATLADLIALPETTRCHEIVAGELVQRPAPTGEHGAAQAALTSSLFGSFSRPPGGRVPGGWWFETAVEIELEAHEVYRPDVVGCAASARRKDRAARRFASAQTGSARSCQHRMRRTILGCCRLADVNPVEYLTDVLPRLARGVRLRDVPAMLPVAWKAARPATDVAEPAASLIG